MGCRTQTHAHVPVRVPLPRLMRQLQQSDAIGRRELGRLVPVSARRQRALLPVAAARPGAVARRQLLRGLGVPIRDAAAPWDRDDPLDLRPDRAPRRPSGDRRWCAGRHQEGVARVRPGGLNQDPVSPNFEEWDKFGQAARGKRQADRRRASRPVRPATQVESPTGGLKPLSRAYRRFKLGPGITQITVEKPATPTSACRPWCTRATAPGRPRTRSSASRCGAPRCQGPPGRADPGDLEQLADPDFARQRPAAAAGDQHRLLALHRRGVGTSTYSTPSDSMEESWNATGLVYERILADDIKAPRFIFNLSGGSVTWSMTGHSNGCAVKAGPATLPVRADGYNGQLDIRSSSGASGTWDRRYYAQAFGFPAVQERPPVPLARIRARSRPAPASSPRPRVCSTFAPSRPTGSSRARRRVRTPQA